MSLRRAAVVGIALATAFAAAGEAQQQRPRPPAQAPATPVPEPAEVPLAYEPELLRLSETLGVIAFVSQLCAEADAEDWRRRAQQIIEAEGATQARRDRFAGAFNRGFLGHQGMHRACTEAARLVLDRRRAEARRITQDISTRFGG